MCFFEIIISVPLFDHTVLTPFDFLGHRLSWRFFTDSNSNKALCFLWRQWPFGRNCGPTHILLSYRLRPWKAYILTYKTWIKSSLLFVLKNKTEWRLISSVYFRNVQLIWVSRVSEYFHTFSKWHAYITHMYDYYLCPVSRLLTTFLSSHAPVTCKMCYATLLWISANTEQAQ